MKKIIVILTLFIASLAVPVVLASPSHASCSSFWNVKSASKVVPYGTANAEWRVYVWLWWRHCDKGLIAEQYRVTFSPADKGNCFRINEWRVNPNIIGDYNPGTRNIDCDGQNDETATWNLHNTSVPNNSDASKRCLGAKVIVSVRFAKDPNFKLPSLCLPLT